MGITLRLQWRSPRAPLADSLQRTGLGFVDSLVIHDLEPTPHRTETDDGVSTARKHLETLESSGFAKLQSLRARGVKAFGAGVNIDEDGEDPRIKREWNREYVKRLLAWRHTTGGGIDFLLLANMHSLLTHEAEDLGILDECYKHGVGIVIGGPFSSGILATGADPKDGSVPKYNYQPASDGIRERVRNIEKVCLSHGVPLIAAALQYPLRHPAVCSVIPGGAGAAEVASNVALMNVEVPEAMWAELVGEGFYSLK